MALFAAVLTTAAAAGDAAPVSPVVERANDPRRSSFDFMSPQTQAMQRDDTLNPGMLWVAAGDDLWNQKAGSADRSCASCHGDAKTSLRGVAARYPAYDATLRRPVDLAQRINRCRQQHQRAEPLAAESAELLGLQSTVAHASRGMPITPDADARLQPFTERGRQLFEQRLGQLNLSCAQCHDGLAGRRLGSSPIPQAHPTGFPVYRLEWQGLGSLQRRLRNCMTGVRAEPFAYGAPELVELELFLAQRARGMLLEAPAVRP
ncbi:MAG: cytochrome C [Methylibium sp. NZG]|nr:MAG: cytochrome C [Methylibium sp. NZG]